MVGKKKLITAFSQGRLQSVCLCAPILKHGKGGKDRGPRPPPPKPQFWLFSQLVGYLNSMFFKINFKIIKHNQGTTCRVWMQELHAEIPPPNYAHQSLAQVTGLVQTLHRLQSTIMGPSLGQTTHKDSLL